MKCVFCDIIAGKIPAEKLYENDLVVAIKNIKPEAPSHYLILPKVHLVFEGLSSRDEKSISALLLAAKEIGDQKLPGGYRLILNVGPDSNREIDHMHVHVLGGKNLGPLLNL